MYAFGLAAFFYYACLTIHACTLVINSGNGDGINIIRYALRLVVCFFRFIHDGSFREYAAAMSIGHGHLMTFSKYRKPDRRRFSENKRTDLLTPFAYYPPYCVMRHDVTMRSR